MTENGKQIAAQRQADLEQQKQQALQGMPITKEQIMQMAAENNPYRGTAYEQMYMNNPYRMSMYQGDALDFLGDVFGIRTAADDYETQRKLAYEQYNAELAAMAAQNEYNTPEQQAARMREAGMNPDLQGIESNQSVDYNAPESPNYNLNSQERIQSIFGGLMGAVELAFGIVGQVNEIQGSILSRELGVFQAANAAAGAGLTEGDLGQLFSSKKYNKSFVRNLEILKGSPENELRKKAREQAEKELELQAIETENAKKIAKGSPMQQVGKVAKEFVKLYWETEKLNLQNRSQRNQFEKKVNETKNKLIDTLYNDANDPEGTEWSRAMSTALLIGMGSQADMGIGAGIGLAGKAIGGAAKLFRKPSPINIIKFPG